jgi:hypothetical protein
VYLWKGNVITVTAAVKARLVHALIRMRAKSPEKVKDQNFGNPGYSKGDQRAGGGGSNGGGGKRTRIQGVVEKGDLRRGRID